VQAWRRGDLDFASEGAVEELARRAPEGCVVLHSVPSLAEGRDKALLRGLESKATRVVYLSTTGVYGDVEYVDHRTPVGPRNERERARVATEEAVLGGPWEALVLRPAAIYGPGRGVHASMRVGKYRLLGDGSNFISRIHVEDLAALAEAALLSDLAGAFPVADRQPCAAREIAEYCAELLGVAAPVESDWAEVPETRRTNRRVDGREVFARLGVEMRYPGYREGIAQALEVERLESLGASEAGG
jgi:nucleoside-diphosphate-sugar epimerase